uniref:F-box domain-containing protein n=1 Tax=Mycena chlorophos TaxID=658473 RepID=A0ABQ0L5U7_MYCCL|nr:predicted protein [Mycena chlorophos]
MESTAALRAQIASVDKEILSARKHLADLETSRDALVAELNRVAVYPVLTLPPEITSEIFIQCLPVPDEPDDGPVRYTYADAPLLLLRVCTTWAHIARSTPPLWSTLNLDVEGWEPEHIDGVLATWFSASRGTTLTLHIWAWEEHGGFAAVMRSLGTHSARVTTLTLQFSPTTLPLFVSSRFRWEALTELHISNESIAERDVDPQTFSTAFDDLLRSSGSLKKLKLHELPLSLVTSRHEQLTHFECSDYSLAQVFEVLKLLPNLLQLDVGPISDDAAYDSLQHHVIHPHLQRLEIAFQDCENDLLEFLTLPQLNTLAFTPRDDTIISNFLARSGAALTTLELTLHHLPHGSVWFSDLDSPLLNSLLELKLVYLPTRHFVRNFLRWMAEDESLPLLQKLSLATAMDMPGFSDIAVKSAAHMSLRNENAAAGEDSELKTQPLRALHVVFEEAIPDGMTFGFKEDVLRDYQELKAQGVDVYFGTPEKSLV